jgi:hypothetical protein
MCTLIPFSLKTSKSGIKSSLEEKKIITSHNKERGRKTENPLDFVAAMEENKNSSYRRKKAKVIAAIQSHLR